MALFALGGKVSTWLLLDFLEWFFLLDNSDSRKRMVGVVAKSSELGRKMKEYHKNANDNLDTKYHQLNKKVYLLIPENPGSDGHLKKSQQSMNVKNIYLDKVIMYEELTPKFYIKYFLSLIVKLVIFQLIIYYLSNRKDWSPLPFSLWSYPSAKGILHFIQMHFHIYVLPHFCLFFLI